VAIIQESIVTMRRNPRKMLAAALASAMCFLLCAWARKMVVGRTGGGDGGVRLRRAGGGGAEGGAGRQTPRACAAPDTASLAGVVPGWYFLNIDSNVGRRHALLRALHADCGVPDDDIHRVPGVTGVKMDAGIVSSWFSARATAFIVADDVGRPIRIRTRGPRLAKEVAVLLGHLRAVKMAYDANHAHVIIMEDDVSFEYVDQWYKGWSVGLREVLGALENLSSGGSGGGDGTTTTTAVLSWDVCQLAYTWFSPMDILKFAQHMLARLMSGRVIDRRYPGLHKDMWSATAYLISRRGMKKLLDLTYPGGSATGPSFDSILAGEGPLVEFDFSSSIPVAVADAVVYGAPLEAWHSTRPLFSYSTASSTLHADHLGKQEMSKQAIERLLYLKDVGLRDDVWHPWYAWYSNRDGEFAG
jgi:hypothetical protein